MLDTYGRGGSHGGTGTGPSYYAQLLENSKKNNFCLVG